MTQEQLIIMAIVASVVSLALLLVSSRWPNLGRTVFAAIFGVSGLINLYFAVTDPTVYVNTFGPQASISLYRDFIYGSFSTYAAWYIGAMAVAQFAIAGLMLLTHNWARTGLVAGVIFLLAVAPLGLIGGFPATLILALSIVLLMAEEYDQPAWEQLSAPSGGTHPILKAT